MSSSRLRVQATQAAQAALASVLLVTSLMMLILNYNSLIVVPITRNSKLFLATAPHAPTFVVPLLLNSSVHSPRNDAVTGGDDGTDNSSNVNDTIAIDRSRADTSITSLRFLIHVGPPKTGTTTLQEHLTVLQNHGYLEQDNWYQPKFRQLYTFRDNTTIYGETKSRVSASLGDEDVDDYITNLGLDIATFRSTNTNIIMSHEVYARLFSQTAHYERLRAMIEDIHGYTMELVIGYRPYFEYVQSSWYQSVRVDYPSRTQPWLNVDGSKFLTSRSIGRQVDILPNRFTNDLLDRARSVVKTIHVLDLHNDPVHYIEMLVCDILQTKVSCEYERQKLAQQANKISNKSKDIHVRADAIGIEAARRGWVDIQTHSRLDVMKGIMKYFTNDIDIASCVDLPMDCSDEMVVYNDLLARTLQIDRHCVLEKNTTDSTAPSAERCRRDEDLTKQIQSQYLDEKLFCELNVTEFFRRYQDIEMHVRTNFL